MHLSVGVCLFTLNASRHLPHCLPPLIQSSLRPKILIVDSSSTDGTVAIAEGFGIEVISISRDEFDHGLTREMARRKIGTDIVVMMTQDAYAIEAAAVETLIAPIVKGLAAVTYGRQIPHVGADHFESFHREYNYPKESYIRHFYDAEQFGRGIYFCSDSFAAYSNQALNAIGGFKKVLLGEDTVAAAELLRAGYGIAYVADAVVRHSHQYTLTQEFRRSFDTGYARRSYEHLLVASGGDEVKGRAYAKQLFTEIYQNKPFLLPYTAALIGVKWLGYRFGRLCYNAPSTLCKLFSAHSSFWIEKKTG